MKLVRALCVLAAAEAFVAPTPLRKPYATLAATSQQADAGKGEKAAKLPTIVDGSHPMFGKRLRVRGAKMSRSGADRFSNLRCFAEPGDPYASPLNYLLAHGDEVTCLDFKDFAGQTWVMHEVDERLRGLTKDGAPPAAGTYLAWSYMDFQGARWLVPEGDDEDSW